MWLRRLSIVGANITDNPNKYYKPEGVFNVVSATNEIQMPNCTNYSNLRGYEAMEATYRFPWVRNTLGYGSAKTWYDTTILPKGKVLKEGSVAVFDGNYGHVVVVEKVLGNNRAIISESQYDDNKSLRNYKYWQTREVDLIVGKSTLSGIGPLIGYIYLEINDIRVERNTRVDQIRVNDDYINIRKNPGLKSEKYDGCYCPDGVYNVLEIKNVDGYDWYKLQENCWIAGVEEVEYLKGEQVIVPEPVLKDINVEQIYINYDKLNIRVKPTVNSESLGYFKKGYYNILEKVENENYTWYRIDNVWAGDDISYYTPEKNDNSEIIIEESLEESWIKPDPCKEDVNKDQVFVGTSNLRIRKEPSTNSEVMGICEVEVNYDVYEVINNDEYTWYKIGDNSYVAQCDKDIIYYPKGSIRIIPELLKELEITNSNLEMIKNIIDSGRDEDKYEQLYQRLLELNYFIEDNFDSWDDYDLVDTHNYDEISLLYTADVHGAWVGYDEDGNYLNPLFSYDDILKYKNTLKKNNIKALLVDCGDWSRPCKVYNDYIEKGKMISADEMNEKEYFASTYGNHEWRWHLDEKINIENILNTDESLIACNLFKNDKLLYKPYKTAKIGDKKLAVIGVGYPSANGQESFKDDVWTYDEYSILDNKKLFNEVQKYIDLFKENNFDYIVVISHMCKSTYESDERYLARTDSLIKNTSGLTAVLQGHYNFATNAEIIKDKDNNSVLLAHESGANLNSFGRLSLSKNGISSYLLDERSDLKNI